MLAQSMESAVEGTPVGVYRERDELLPIIARSPEAERVDMDNLGGIQVWSPAAQGMVPAAQVVTGFSTEFENPHLWRRNRMKMIKLHADPRRELPSELFARVKAPIERSLGVDVGAVLGESVASNEAALENLDAATLAVTNNSIWPLAGLPGYSMAWGGEAEDSARAQGSLAGAIPVFFGLMVLIVLFLFNSIKKTLVIWLCVPLAIIGVTVGLLLFEQPFGFMALLGLMSLAGMLIKNAIVLIDQIDADLAAGKEPFRAIVDSGVSRMIPVLMAAITTILGMLPLLTDAFFVAMAVTIMFGLGFATILTLIVVPVLYAILFRVPNPAR
jgi:multidrug efflux pump subunit AcrB